MSLIIFHELGHSLMAVILKVRVDKICIYPFGGLSKFNFPLSGSLKKELLILLMGPIMQIIFTAFLISNPYFLKEALYIKNISIILLVFNLLPIYPLDGGRLLHIFLEHYLSFKRSLTFTFLISYIIIITLFIVIFCKEPFINTLLISFLLFYKVTDEFRKRNYIFEKFLLERYLENYHFKKRKKVKEIGEFMNERTHIIEKDGKYYSEREILRKKFEKI